MRGDKENQCLKKIKDSFFNLDDFSLEYVGYSFNRKEIENILKNAVPNKSPNDFPDFTTNNGFIEHFEVTTAKESKSKGSNYYVEEKKFENKCNNFKFDDNIPYHSNQILTNVKRFKYDEGSYENFVKSFKKNWDKHIGSLKKYSGAKKLSVFMIENNGANLIYNNNGHTCEFYTLSGDKNLLNFIYDYNEYIKYVFFKSCDRYEFIKIADIPKYINNLSIKKYEAGRSVSVKTDGQIDL